MNEETLEVMMEENWGDGGGAGAELSAEGAQTQETPPKAPEAGIPQTCAAQQPPRNAPQPVPQRPEPIRVPKGVPGQEHPLLTRMRGQMRNQDLQRFLQTYPGVKAEQIPNEVWAQVSRGSSLVNAYTMHENARLRAQLAAEQHNRANRMRSTGGLGANSGFELDELDRMWNEDD